MSPGMREYLFNPKPSDQPCLGSVSPVSNVNSPGLPSSAGIGVKFGRSESSSATAVAFDLAAPELGFGGAEGGGVGAGAVVAAEELSGIAAVPNVPLAVAESVAAVAVFPVVSFAARVEGAPAAVAPAPAVPSGTRGLVSSANAATFTKKTAKTKIVARSSNLKVRLLTSSQPTSPRADDSTHSFPRRRRDEKITGLEGGLKKEVSSVSY